MFEYPQELFLGIFFMAKVPPKNRPHGVRVREERKLDIMIRYVPAPDAEIRLSRAVDILLGAATENITLPEEDSDAPISPAKESANDS